MDIINEKACEDMKTNIVKGSCVRIAAVFFSMYAYNFLREQLEYAAVLIYRIANIGRQEDNEKTGLLG